MTITSSKNPLLQEVRRATQSGRLMPDGCVVLEGPHLVEEVFRSPWQVVQILATPATAANWERLAQAHHSTLIEVSERALEATGSAETTQGVIALAKPLPPDSVDPRSRITQMLAPGALIVVMDGIQDPGNAGTLLRSAEAFGATGVIACKGSVRLANAKFLRASAGSIFRLPFVDHVLPEDVASWLSPVPVYALTAGGARHLDQIDLRHPCAVVVGNEGAGVSEAILARAITVNIPVHQVESLNAAVAGSIALFEAARQRRAS